MDNETKKILNDIKWLLVMQLQRQGVSSRDIATALQVDPAVVSRRMPRAKKNDGKSGTE